MGKMSLKVIWETIFIITEGEVVVIKTDRKTGEEKELTAYIATKLWEISMTAVVNESFS